MYIILHIINIMKIDNQIQWHKILHSLSDPSYLQSINKQDATMSKQIQIKSFKQSQMFRIKSIPLFGIFVLFIIFAITIWIYAFSHSILGRITKGTDFRGNVCNQNALIGKKFLYYPDVIRSPDFSICVEQCPQLIADVICLYDINGNNYNSIDQSHLCYQTLESLNEGKYCFPLQVISSKYLNMNLNLGGNQINRISSDVVNSYMNIIICIIVGVVITVLIDRFAFLFHLFNKCFGFAAITINLLLGIGFAIICFSFLKVYINVYCPKGLNATCNFGKVYSFQIILYLILSLIIVYILIHIFLYKRIKKMLDFSNYIACLKTSRKQLLRSLLFLAFHICFIIFFGVGAAMSLSNSSLQNQYAQNIDNNQIKTIAYNNPIRYIIFALILFGYLVCLKFLEKLNYFIISIDTEITFMQLVKASVYHSGELMITALMDLILYPLKIYGELLVLVFEHFDKNNSYNKFFQKSIIFYPFLYVYFHLLRYLEDETIAFFHFNQSYITKIQIYFHLKSKFKLNMAVVQNTDFICFHLRILVTLIVGLFSLVLLNSTSTLSGIPTSLIQNPVTVVVITMILTYLHLLLYSKEKIIRIELIYAKYQIYSAIKHPSLQLLKQKYSIILELQEQKINKNEITKQELLNPTYKTEEEMIHHHITTFKINEQEDLDKHQK